MLKPQLHIGHLYPSLMSTYGDIGNIICLNQRAGWRDIEVTVHALELDVPIPKDIDFYFFGGGQDTAQQALGTDLLEKKGERLRDDISKGVPLLAICGGYQLLGNFYQPFDGTSIQGLGIFPVETYGSQDRMIGDLIIQANQLLGFSGEQTIVGFENHSGKTRYIDAKKAQPLGQVLGGFGNNGEDKTEGCTVNNAIGCYLHGSLLPKNPHLADWLLMRMLENNGIALDLKPLEDDFAWKAHRQILERINR